MALVVNLQQERLRPCMTRSMGKAPILDMWGSQMRFNILSSCQKFSGEIWGQAAYVQPTESWLCPISLGCGHLLIYPLVQLLFRVLCADNVSHSCFCPSQFLAIGRGPLGGEQRTLWYDYHSLSLQSSLKFTEYFHTHYLLVPQICHLYKNCHFHSELYWLRSQMMRQHTHCKWQACGRAGGQPRHAS